MRLFEDPEPYNETSAAPLAARMRPRTFDEFVGQEHIIGPNSVLRKSVQSGRLSSIILWGPPGTGKTTLAQILATAVKANFCTVSAVTAGVADLRRIVDDAKKLSRATGRATVLFIDELHRFNKAQQDVILPHVEDGTVTLIGATTENPSFEVNSALLSRSRVFVLNALAAGQIQVVVDRAVADAERGLGNLDVKFEEGALEALCALANGDARVALNALELAVQATKPTENDERVVSVAAVEDAMQHRALMYDKGGEQHYDIISALHKSMRDSDPDAGLYWLGRMLEAGEDPLYVARRLVRFATEDVGLADPQALQIAVAAQQAVHFIGMPEGNLALAEAVVYLATAPKSNSLYKAYGKVQEDVKRTRTDPVPLHLRNAVTGLMKNLGYGKGYKYAHNFEGHFVRQQHLPDNLSGTRYYEPGDAGYEQEVRRRLEEWRKRE
ncbi:MAG: replication-associated recombination protein A [Chloroflexi bacterium]|nr:replication-associated recombination protein A [Chloroflexota bacterium]